MSAFKKFDPYAVISEAGTLPKVAKVAKLVTANLKAGATLGALGTLGGLGADITNPSAPSFAAAAPEMGVDPLGSAQSGPAQHTPANVPADWVAGLERLNTMACPISVEGKRWSQLQEDAKRFVDAWGGHAAALGWSALDIFGCHPALPSCRQDCMGLVWLVAGAEIRAMSTEVVTLRRSSGSLRRARKSAVIYGRTLAWEL
jgi:hypothetical protein